MRLTVALLLGTCVLVGCSKSEPKSGPGGVTVDAPGVNVKVNEKGGAEVNVPGVNVKVNP